jgi:hypothetical protein
VEEQTSQFSPGDKQSLIGLMMQDSTVSSLLLWDLCACREPVLSRLPTKRGFYKEDPSPFSGEVYTFTALSMSV